MQPLIVRAEHGEAPPARWSAGSQPRALEDMAGTPTPRPENHGAKPREDQPSRRPKAVSLFSGCGGSDAGLISAGFDIILANDIAAYARDLYQVNLPGDRLPVQGHPQDPVIPESGPARRLLPLPGVQPRRGTAIRPESKLPVPGVR